ncbi:hypothetical protein F2Q69_00021643 [Brassica cretica]|uniref:Uncharacterized protein n=1 Tax=Brassica cretica TaxID=69181 RepID=A0A8S9PZ08_BRACR|nr:hypothetical protein F2Q69_00021643 [Brassica cretica]
MGFIDDNKQEDEMGLGCSELKTTVTFEGRDGEEDAGDGSAREATVQKGIQRGKKKKEKETYLQLL